MRTLALATVAATAVIAGCTGSSTYGTGKSQEAHLVDGVTGLFSLRTLQGEKIEYQERPEIVKPANAQLVEPVAGSGDGSFPVNPEVARTRSRTGANENIDPLTGNFSGQFSRSRKAVSNPQVVVDDDMTEQERQMEELSPGWRIRHDKEAQRKRRAQIAAQNGTSLGTGSRRYLTQPPVRYRKPYETAPVGEVGETEKSKEFKKENKGSLLSKLNPFD